MINKIIIVTLLTLSLVSINSYSQKIDIGLFSTGTGSLTVLVRPTTDVNLLYSNVTFTISYPASYNVDLTVSSTTFGFATNPDQVCFNGATKQAIFSSLPNIVVNWSAGQEIAIATIAVSKTGNGTGTFTLATTALCLGDGSHYEELSIAGTATDVSGFVYAPTVANVALPLTLLDFIAKPQTENIALSWLTADEKNVKGFDIQRSTNGENFTTLDFKKSNGGGIYTLMDINVTQNQIYYYRLNMIDNDGASTFSKIVSASLARTVGVKIYPNPTKESVTIDLIGIKAATIRVTDVLGREILVVNNAATKNELNVFTYHNGIYFIEVCTDGEKFVQKVVKE